MTPNTDSARAYQEGYQAACEGKSEDANPFVYVGQHRGIALSSWWSAGFSDQRNGVPQRWSVS